MESRVLQAAGKPEPKDEFLNNPCAVVMLTYFLDNAQIGGAHISGSRVGAVLLTLSTPGSWGRLYIFFNLQILIHFKQLDESAYEYTRLRFYTLSLGSD